MIWYHGSPIKFDKFELGHKSNSNLPFRDCIAFTKDEWIAKAFACKSQESRYLYIVELLHNGITQEYTIASLEDGLDNKKTNHNCIKVYDMNDIKIIEIIDLINEK